MPPKSSGALLKGRTTAAHLAATSQATSAASETTGAITGLSSDVPRVIEIDIANITRNSSQPRTVFNEASLQSLAESIDRYGLKTPILVRPLGGGHYEVVAGERRLRAMHLLQRATIPAILCTKDTEEVALLENVQREDLNAVDLAFGLRQLADKGFTHSDIAQFAGLNRTIVTRLLKVCDLPDAVLTEYRAHAATEGTPVSRTAMMEIAAAPDADAQLRLWAAAKSGQVVREVIERRQIAKDATQHAHRTLAASFKRLEKDVTTIIQHAPSLDANSRARLQALRDEIDKALELT